MCPRSEAQSEASSALVVVFTDAAYAPIFALWYALFRAHAPKQPLLAVAMDEHARDALVEWLQGTHGDAHAFVGFMPYDFGAKKKTGGLWPRRLGYLRRVAALCADVGVPMIHSDADAFWFGDAAAAVCRYGGDVVVSSNTRGVPPVVQPLWGFNLCCGFFMVRPTRAALAFMDRWLAATRERGDDQIALNIMLANENVAWLGSRISGWSAHAAAGGGVRAAVLSAPPPCVFTRRPHLRAACVVFHAWLLHRPIAQKTRQCYAWVHGPALLGAAAVCTGNATQRA